jgi:hypothetical protein
MAIVRNLARKMSECGHHRFMESLSRFRPPLHWQNRAPASPSAPQPSTARPNNPLGNNDWRRRSANAAITTSEIQLRSAPDVAIGARTSAADAQRQRENSGSPGPEMDVRILAYH